MATNTEKYSEESLVKSLKLNQQSAFEYLYENYSRVLFGVISRIVKDEEKAADVMQDVFLKIWKKIGDFDAEKSRLYAWMVSIARNAAIDQYRKEKNNVMLNIDREIAAVDGQNQELASTDTIDLRGIVEKLKPERKQLLDLVYLQGFTQEEAAEMLQIPLGTAKSRIRTALHELKLYYAV